MGIVRGGAWAWVGRFSFLREIWIVFLMPWISLSPVCRQAIRVQVCALHHGLNILVTSSLGVWKEKGSLSSLSLLYSPDTARLIVLGTSFAESQQSPVGLHTWLHLVYPPLSPATNTSILISSRPSCLFFFFLNHLWMYQAHTCSVLFTFLCGMKIFLLDIWSYFYSSSQVQLKPTSSLGYP